MPVRLLATIVFVCSLTPLFAQRPAPAPAATLEEREKAWGRHQELAQSSLFRGLQWRNVGPVIQGGRVVDIESVPGKPFSFYVAYASGGLWKTENSGQTFEPIFDEQATLIMGDVAVDPSKPETLWVGTGENNSSRSSYGGHGVYRSDNGGESWRYMGLGESDRIGTIVVDPADSNRVYVAALGKLYTEGGQRGVYRTTDGGKSWVPVLKGPGMTGAIDLILDPKSTRTVYAALWDRSRRPWNFVESGAGSGIWKSVDGGDSWVQLGDGLPTGDHVGRIGLALCTSKSSVVYASIDNQEVLPESEWDLGDSAISAKRLRAMDEKAFLEFGEDAIEAFIRSNDLDTSLDAKSLIKKVEEGEVTIDDLLRELNDANAALFETDIRGLELYRSTDSGASWSRTHEEPLRNVVFTYGYYFGTIAVSPDDPDQVYLAGVPIIRSDDGGRSFKSLHDRKVHVDHHVIWIDPEHSDRVITGNDGGLDISYDRGEHWHGLDQQPVGQFYTIAVDMKSPYTIYGGTQDNGTLKGSSRYRHGIDSWSFVGGGDGMYVQVAEDGTLYYGYQFGFYNRRDPDGSTHNVRPRDGLGEDAFRYNWSTPIQLSKHNDSVLYFGTNKLFRSMDKGTTWSALSEDLSVSPRRGDVPYACITTIDESTDEFGLIWVGTDDGHLYVTPDSGMSWKSVDAALPQDRWVSRVTASTVKRERAYVSLNGYRDDDIRPYVFVTEDLGDSWRSISAGLPNEAVNVVKEDPVNHDVLYVGTDRGAYVSLDRGKAWHSLRAGMPSVPVHDLVVHPRDRELIAGTHGRSVFVLDALPIQDLSVSMQKSPVHVFPVESMKHSRGWQRRPSEWFDDARFDPELVIPFWAGESGTATLEIRDGDDRPLKRMDMSVERGVHAFRWNLELDVELAVEAEKERLTAKEAEGESDDEEDDETENTKESSDKGVRAERPWSESVRLGHVLRVTPGRYTLHIALGTGGSSTELKIEAAAPWTPRLKKEPPIRGRKDDD